MTIKKGSLVAFEVFRSWFVGEVTRMQTKTKAQVKVFDGSTKSMEVDKLRELSPKAYMPNKALNAQELERLDKGDPAFKPNRQKPVVDTPPAPKPAPTPPKPKEDEELDRKGPPKLIPDIPKALEDRFETLNQSAHMLGKVSPMAALTWFKNCWKWANAKKFGGQLKEPDIKLMKMSSASRFRTRGYWRGSTREMVLSPRLFWSDVQVVAEVVIHEMSHQATHEISRDFDRSQQGHGPTWRSWMIKVGLNPNRYDHRTNYDNYSSEQDKRKLSPFRWIAENNLVRIETWDELNSLAPRTQVYMLNYKPNGKFEVVPAVYLQTREINGKTMVSLRVGTNILRVSLANLRLYRSKTGASVIDVPKELRGEVGSDAE